MEHSTMALHYFHSSNGLTTLDDLGTDLPDLLSVRKEVLRALRELLVLGSSDARWIGDPWRVWVTDQPNATGRTVLALELKELDLPEIQHRSCECGALYERSEAEAKGPERQVAAFECRLCGMTLESWNSTNIPTYRILAGPIRLPER
jgi:hypothetical protein